MRMCRAFCREGFSRAHIAAVLCCLLLAACQTDDNLVTGSVGPDGPRTIAFESIDGPPEPVFERLVAQLSNEANTRKLPVISRTNAAAWRVRLYLAAHVQKNKAAITWVGDVYDARYDRAFRISGEEPVSPARKDVWALADDAVLARIATNSLDAIMKGPQAAAEPSPAASATPPAPASDPTAETAPAAAPEEETPVAVAASRSIAFAEPRN